MEESIAVKVHYLDASALVKLVADDPDEEPGRKNIRAFYQSNTNFYATSHCLSEALGVLKRKYSCKKLTKDEYIKAVMDFISKTVGDKLRIDDMPLLSPKLLAEAETLMAQHGLDFVDCVQIVTILHGQFSVLVGDSQSVLITADKKLAKVARTKGARVWLCTDEPPP